MSLLLLAAAFICALLATIGIQGRVNLLAAAITLYLASLIVVRTLGA